MDLTRRVNSAAALGKPDVHEDQVGKMSRCMADGRAGRRCDRTYLMTELHYQNLEVHQYESFVLDD